ncbi:MAG: ATP-binding protein [Bacillota bacterium]
MIKREILEKILPWLDKEKILIIKGARQVGKTFIMKQLKNELESRGEKVVYLLADDIDNRPIFSSLSSLEAYLRQYHGFPNGVIYLMIDEFQVIEEAGVFLKNVYDRYRSEIRLIVSGSSSLEINKNSEYLTGRAIHFNVGRVSFKEYFDYEEGTATELMPLSDFKKLKNFYALSGPRLEATFGTYLSYGGYPEVLITDDVEQKEEILKSIIKTYIDKDIINQLQVENVTGFNNLIKILASQAGQLVRYKELSDTANLATNTLRRYLEILSGTYIVDFVRPYFRNIRTEISKMPKIFLLDTGIRNYLLRSYSLESQEMGNVVENSIYLELLARFDKDNIHYYRTNSGSEIDFVIEGKGKSLLLIEVKYRSKTMVTLPMKTFPRKYPEGKMRIMLTKNALKYEDGIYFIPAVLFPFVNLEV